MQTTRVDARQHGHKTKGLVMGGRGEGGGDGMVLGEGIAGEGVLGEGKRSLLMTASP